MDSAAWDNRYAGSGLVWSAAPNATVADLVGGLPPGRALDLAAGEGRNALWLAERGWQVTAVDFSAVAVERMAQLAAARLDPQAAALTVVQADVLTWTPQRAAYDLVLLVYVHLPAADRASLHAKAAAALDAGGTLVVLGHDRSNLTGGASGPDDPAILLTPPEVVADLAGTGLAVARSDVIRRPVDVDGQVRHALDCLVVAHRR